MNQFCNITHQKGCLKMDDRLDSLEMAIAALTENLNINLAEIKRAECEERFYKELSSIIGGGRNHNWVKK